MKITETVLMNKRNTLIDLAKENYCIGHCSCMGIYFVEQVLLAELPKLTRFSELFVAYLSITCLRGSFLDQGVTGMQHQQFL